MSLANGVVMRVRPGKHRGLFVTPPIRKGEILIIYDGPLVDHATRYSVQTSDHLHIDGTPESNARLNHSCVPNTYVDRKGVFLRALRDIAANEELTVITRQPIGSYTRSSYAPVVRRPVTAKSRVSSICHESSSEHRSRFCRNS